MSGTPWAVQPVVSVVDAAGRVVGDDYTTLVTLAIDGSAVGARAELRCASGPVVRAVAGVATFDGCQVVGAGDGYVLRANAQTPAAAILHDLSDPFDIGPDPSRLGLAASPDLVGADGTLTLTATLEGPGAGDAPIVFQRRIEGDADWTPVGTSTTSAVGIASFALRPRHSAWYRAVFVGSGSLAAATSAPDRVGVRAAIALAPGSATVAKGTTIAYTARVTPVPPSSTTVHFVVFRLVGGEWRTFAQRSVPMTAAGVATVSWRWSVAGRWRVAVVAPATAWYEQGMSRLVAVTVR